MPLYSYTCPDCHHEEDIPKRVNERNDPEACLKCGGVMKRTIPRVSLPPNRFPYTHDNLEMKPVRIENRKQEKQEFAKRGLIDAR